MEHGRDHDERITKFGGHTRHSNTPPDDDSEPTARPPTGQRGVHGSEPAPTRRAIEDNAERHARERQGGHIAAGTEGRRKAEDV